MCFFDFSKKDTPSQTQKIVIHNIRMENLFFPTFNQDIGIKRKKRFFDLKQKTLLFFVTQNRRRCFCF